MIFLYERGEIMFRDVVRTKQKLSDTECAAVLRDVPRGVLSVQGDDGYPYGVPTNHWYDPEQGVLYFHSGRSGHKVDAIKACDKVSYCVMDSGMRKEGDWALTYRSVVVFGRVRIVEDMAEAMEIARKLSLQFTADTQYIDHEIACFGKDTLVFALLPDHMTVKCVHEA